jgi:hypothetical protein
MVIQDAGTTMSTVNASLTVHRLYAGAGVGQWAEGAIETGVA